MSYLRNSLRKRGLSETAAELTISSLRKGTIKQYNVYFNQWIIFAARHCLSPFNPTVVALAEFLTTLFERGLTYSSINTARSAVSTFSFVSSKSGIGSDPLICRLMKGIFERRPPVPKYSDTWDVGIVLDYLKRLSPVENLSLGDLSHKTVMLCLLLSGKRCNAIHLFTTEGLKITESSVIFDAVLEKQSRPGRPREQIIFNEYTIDVRLCVVQALKQYFKVTQTLRGTEQQFFIKTQRPYSAVTVQTLAKWVKTVMKNAGIDTTKYSAHSARAATASIAVESEVPVDVLLKAVGWSNANTFATFYKKSIVKEPRRQLAEAVLQGNIKHCLNFR